MFSTRKHGLLSPSPHRRHPSLPPRAHVKKSPRYKTGEIDKVVEYIFFQYLKSMLEYIRDFIRHCWSVAPSVRSFSLRVYRGSE